jgi:SAM-dependent methyltransferase
MCSRVLVEVEREISRVMEGLGAATFLDVGCWDGEFTQRCAELLGAERTLGVEVYEGPASAARARGVEVARVDLEASPLPYEDASVDAVLCNQVLEHLKNIWLPMSEMHRVLRPGGHAVLSVPNLASLHNRVLLALGHQPTSIRVFGPHVRGFTLREFCGLVERGGAYAIEDRRGAGFYPVPARVSGPFARAWTGASHTMVIVARKASAEPVWTDYLGAEVEGGMQTYYGE